MVLPLILTWDKSKIDKEEFLRQLYVYVNEDFYLCMAQSIGTFRASSSRINILRGDKDESGSHYLTSSWMTTEGTPDVYKPLPTREVK